METHRGKATALLTSLAMMVVLLGGSIAYGHSGGLDAAGGHTDHSTGVYHCHREPCVGYPPPPVPTPTPPGGSPDCSYPTGLEITVVNIGQGDATLIATPSRILLADSGESYWNSNADARKVAEVIAARYGRACKQIDYFINSHLHLDHIGYIQADYDSQDQLLAANGASWQEGESLRNPRFRGGIAYLANQGGFEIKSSLFRDYRAHNPNRLPSAGGSKTYWNWRGYLSSPEGIAAIHPTTAVLGTSQIDLGSVNGESVVVDIIQVDAATPSSTNGCNPAVYFSGPADTARGDTTIRATTASENDLSIAFVVSLGDFDMFIGGDTSGRNDRSSFGYSYHDTETCLAEDPTVLQRNGGQLDVLRVNHHGSSHSTNQAFLDAFEPTVSIVSVGDHNPYDHVQDAVLERLLTTSAARHNGAVYLTEAGIEADRWDDLCVTRLFRQYCAVIGDNEFGPPRHELNELGDADVVVVVDPDGSGFTVYGNTPESRRRFASK